LSVLALVTLTFLIVVARSPIRRIGDGMEYLTMASNAARLRPPSAVPSDIDELRAEAQKFGDASWEGSLDPRLRGRDGRFDFPHFWLASVLAAPPVAIVRALGFHPAAGFTVFNFACVLLLMTVVARRAGSWVAVLIGCLLLWWIDKVHAEVFLVTALTVGLLWLDDYPRAALIVLALAAAQMPVFAIVLIVAAALRVFHEPRNTPLWMAAALSAMVAALHPLYYWWHLGRLSPLEEFVKPRIPGMRLFLTPLFDLNLGIVWYAPVLTLLALAGIGVVRRPCSWRTLTSAGVGAIGLLLTAAQTPNVNHGATPGPSRYGLWCLALLMPFAANAAARLAGRARIATLILVAYTLVFSTIVLHPAIPDAGIRPTPSLLAGLVWTHWPALDNPVPEVFAERISGIDGTPPGPLATAHCEKALLIGDGQEVKWPRGCTAAAVPSACAVAGALCYWNSGSVAVAPR
jgi:hypothetical protein